MLELFAIVLPVFGLIGIGHVARQTGFISERAGEGLSEFVFTLSLPCLIFRTLVRAEIPDVQPWGYWISYFVGVAVVWLLATVIGRRFFGIKGVSGVVAGFSASQANTVFVGVPMILKAYGDEGAVPLFLLIAVHLPVTMTSRRSWPKVAKPRLSSSCAASSPIPSSSGSWQGPPAAPSRPMCRLRPGRSWTCWRAPQSPVLSSPWASPCAATVCRQAGSCRP
jgi:hypothetical protein